MAASTVTVIVLLLLVLVLACVGLSRLQSGSISRKRNEKGNGRDGVGSGFWLLGDSGNGGSDPGSGGDSGDGGAG